jgi:hypothetical protein
VFRADRSRRLPQWPPLRYCTDTIDDSRIGTRIQGGDDGRFLGITRNPVGRDLRSVGVLGKVIVGIDGSGTTVEGEKRIRQGARDIEGCNSQRGTTGTDEHFLGRAALDDEAGDHDVVDGFYLASGGDVEEAEPRERRL